MLARDDLPSCGRISLFYLWKRCCGAAAHRRRSWFLVEKRSRSKRMRKGGTFTTNTLTYFRPCVVVLGEWGGGRQLLWLCHLEPACLVQDLKDKAVCCGGWNVNLCWWWLQTLQGGTRLHIHHLIMSLCHYVVTLIKNDKEISVEFELHDKRTGAATLKHSLNHGLMSSSYSNVVIIPRMWAG